MSRIQVHYVCNLARCGLKQIVDDSIHHPETDSTKHLDLIVVDQGDSILDGFSFHIERAILRFADLGLDQIQAIGQILRKDARQALHFIGYDRDRDKTFGKADSRCRIHHFPGCDITAGYLVLEGNHEALARSQA